MTQRITYDQNTAPTGSKILQGDIIDKDGSTIARTTYRATETRRTFSQVYDDARYAVSLVIPTDVFKGHRFKVIDGICRYCHLSRASFEFSRRTLECGHVAARRQASETRNI